MNTYLNQEIVAIRIAVLRQHLKHANHFREIAKRVEILIGDSKSKEECTVLKNLLVDVTEEMRRSVIFSEALLEQPKLHLVVG